MSASRATILLTAAALSASLCLAAPTQAPTVLPPEFVSDDPSFDVQVPILRDMDLYWRVEADCSVSFRASIPGDRWMSFGFGTRMSNGKVVIAHSSSTVGEFTMTSKEERDINEYTGSSGIVGTPEWTFESGVRTLRINMTSIAGVSFLSGCDGANARVPAEDQSWIVAYGRGLDFEEHTRDGQLTINWDSGIGGQLEPGSAALDAHAFMMSIAFGILMPVLILFPATKRPESKWFLLHRGTAMLSLAMILGGLVAGIVHVSDEGGSHFSEPHHIVGLLAILLVLANPVLGQLRPGKDSASRKMWLMAHRVVGYGAVIMGLADVLVGADLVEDSEAYGGENSMAVGATFVAIGAVLLLVAAGTAVKKNAVTTPKKADGIALT